MDATVDDRPDGPAPPDEADRRNHPTETQETALAEALPLPPQTLLPLPLPPLVPPTLLLPPGRLDLVPLAAAADDASDTGIAIMPAADDVALSSSVGG